MQIINKVVDCELLYFAEMYRTETKYEESLSMKLFMMLSFNYYSHAFYIAFLKGRLI
jgi:hypothetical protein